MYYLTEEQFVSLRNTANRNDVMNQVSKQIIPEENEISVKIDEETKTYLREMGAFYYEHENKSSKEAVNLINAIQITNCQYIKFDNLLKIAMVHPGIFIGKNGHLIDALSKYLKDKFNNPSLKIHIIENSTNSFLKWF